MNHSLIALVASDTVRMVGVEFLDRSGDKSRTYSYKTNDPTIKVGDLIVVPTQQDLGNYGVATVTTLDGKYNFNDTVTYRWIVGKVDLSAYVSLLDKEKAAIERYKDIERNKARDDLREELSKTLGADTVALLAKEIGV